MKTSKGLPPVIGDNARVLILGSLPSVRSIELQQYYAFPTNAFWSIMGALFDAGRELEYSDRLNILMSRGIALWDTLASSVRAGSLDANIDHSTAQVNDFPEILADNCRIRLIAFNGQESQKSFERYVIRDPAVPLPELDYRLMPSTSAANAMVNVQQKIEAWSVIKEYLPASRD